MAAVPTDALFALALNDGPSSVSHLPFFRLLLASLALHGAVLMVLEGFRLLSMNEPPLVAHEISLVSLPMPTKEARPARRLSGTPRPAPKSKPAVQPKLAVPPSSESVAVVDTSKTNPVLPPPAPAPLFQKALGDILLPPEAPKLESLDPLASLSLTSPIPVQTDPLPPSSSSAIPVEPLPSKKTRKLEQDVRSLVEKLTVPEVPTRLPESPLPLVKEKAGRPSLTEDVRGELRKLDPLDDVTANLTEDFVKESQNSEVTKPSPVREAIVRALPGALAHPITSIQTGTTASVSAQYLAIVQQRISSGWVAPPVEHTGDSLEVVVKFRLDRSGDVSNVVVEHTSGNEYFDLAARRAVLSADPLPSFPPNIHDSYWNTHFTFRVGGSVS